MADSAVVDIKQESDGAEKGSPEVEDVAWERNRELSIWERVHAVMTEVRTVGRDSEMTMGSNTIKYTSHDEATEAVRDAMLRHGIAVHPTAPDYEVNGNRVEMLVKVAFVNIDKPEDRIVVDMPSFGVSASDKGPGIAMSYAVKTAILKQFQLIGGGEPEADTQHDPAEPTASQEERQKHKAAEETVEWAETFRTAIQNATSVDEIDRLYRANNKTLRDVPQSTRDYFADLRERRTGEFLDAEEN